MSAGVVARSRMASIAQAPSVTTGSEPPNRRLLVNHLPVQETNARPALAFACRQVRSASPTAPRQIPRYRDAQTDAASGLCLGYFPGPAFESPASAEHR